MAMKVIKFTNATQKRFAHPNHPTAPGEDEHCQWDGVAYSFEPGESAWLEFGVATVLAKHLINRELHAQGLDGVRGKISDTNDPLGKDRIQPQHVNELLSKILDASSMRETNSLLELQRLDRVVQPNVPEVSDDKGVTVAKKGCEKCGSKGYRHKKGCELLKPVEEEFEGLND